MEITQTENTIALTIPQGVMTAEISTDANYPSIALKINGATVAVLENANGERFQLIRYDEFQSEPIDIRAFDMNLFTRTND